MLALNVVQMSALKGGAAASIEGWQGHQMLLAELTRAAILSPHDWRSRALDGPVTPWWGRQSG